MAGCGSIGATGSVAFGWMNNSKRDWCNFIRDVRGIYTAQVCCIAQHFKLPDPIGDKFFPMATNGGVIWGLGDLLSKARCD